MALAYVEREDPSGGIFASTRFLAHLVGHVITIHDNNVYAYINMASAKPADGEEPKGTNSEVNADNDLNVTEEKLNDV